MAEEKSAKAKTDRARQGTTVEWRGKPFSSREELISYAEDSIRKLLGPPAIITSGDDIEFLTIKPVRLKLELSDKPLRRRSSTPAVEPRRTARTKLKSLPPVRLPKRDTYFH